jgi:hypothetical protein
MYIAVTEDNKRVSPRKKVLARCPCCKMPVVAKMGKLKTHHWAHKSSTNCSSGKGMTEWHYNWIKRHNLKSGWEVEYQDERFRYDCFNQVKKLVLEIQKLPLYDYIVEKTAFVTSKGWSIYWILHLDIFANFEVSGTHYTALSTRGSVILDILEMFAERSDVHFYVDTLAIESNGYSSRGLAKLEPNSRKNNARNHSGYYNIAFIKQNG